MPQSEVPGEQTSPTQPFTLFPPPLAQMTIARDNLSNLSPHSNADCKAVWDKNGLKDGGPFLPPAKNGAWTVMNTGAIGGIDWGGASIDLDRGYAITNVVNMPTMIQVTNGAKAVKGNDGYRFVLRLHAFFRQRWPHLRRWPSWRAGGRESRHRHRSCGTCRSVRWMSSMAKTPRTSAPPTSARRSSRAAAWFSSARPRTTASTPTTPRRENCSGRPRWPTSSNAGPMTYIGKDGRQYVVIAAGGPGNARRRSANDNFAFHQTLVAFALPKPGEKEIDIVDALSQARTTTWRRYGTGAIA